jgi:hypothetical protein
MSRGGYPRTQVDIQAQVPLPRHLWVTRMQPHPKQHPSPARPRMRGYRLLHSHRRCDAGLSITERDEERIPLRVNHMPTTSLDRLPHHAIVLKQYPPKHARTHVPQQSSRTLDISEQERDRPRRLAARPALSDIHACIGLHSQTSLRPPRDRIRCVETGTSLVATEHVPWDRLARSPTKRASQVSQMQRSITFPRRWYTMTPRNGSPP